MPIFVPLVLAAAAGGVAALLQNKTATKPINLDPGVLVDDGETEPEDMRDANGDPVPEPPKRRAARHTVSGDPPPPRRPKVPAITDAPEVKE